MDFPPDYFKLLIEREKMSQRSNTNIVWQDCDALSVPTDRKNELILKHLEKVVLGLTNLTGMKFQMGIETWVDTGRELSIRHWRLVSEHE